MYCISVSPIHLCIFFFIVAHFRCIEFQIKTILKNFNFKNFNIKLNKLNFNINTEPNTIPETKAARLHWLGHIVRMGDGRAAKRVYLGNLTAVGTWVAPSTTGRTTYSSGLGPLESSGVGGQDPL